MNSIAYSAMLEQMDKGAYTEVSAKNTLTVMFAKQMLIKDEYDELMDKSGYIRALQLKGGTEEESRIEHIEELKSYIVDYEMLQS